MREFWKTASAVRNWWRDSRSSCWKLLRWTTSSIKPGSSTRRIRTGMRILAEKLSFILWMVADIGLVLRETFNAEGELNLDLTSFRNHNFLHIGGEALVPGFQCVGASRGVFDAETTLLVGGGVKWILHYENDAAHLGMDRAEDIHAARLSELHLFDFRIFIQAEIEWV